MIVEPRRLSRFAAVCLAAAAAGFADARGAITVKADPPRLTWSLFRRADSMPGSSEDAHIAAEMSFPRPLRIESADGRYRLPPFTITVTPEPTRTLVRRSATVSDDLLRHEQGHYDLVVLAARALARGLEVLAASSASELSRIAEESINEHTARAQRLSGEYDRQTDRSRDRQAQARWNDLIRAALNDPDATRIAGLPL